MLRRLTIANHPDRTRLGDLLVARGRLAPAALERALAEAAPGERLGETLVRLGLARPATIRRTLLEQRARRAVAAAAAVLLTTLVPAAASAAGQGGVGATSTGSVRITLVKPPAEDQSATGADPTGADSTGADSTGLGIGVESMGADGVWADGVRDALRRDAAWDDGTRWGHVQPLCMAGSTGRAWRIRATAPQGLSARLDGADLAESLQPSPTGTAGPGSAGTEAAPRLMACDGGRPPELQVSAGPAAPRQAALTLTVSPE